MIVKKKTIVLAIAGAMGVGALTGCGGGGTKAVVQPQTQTFSGSVVDGPVANAEVCLHSNAHPLMVDGARTCTMSDAHGHYQLTVPVSALDGAGQLTFVATKDGKIVLTSYAGYWKDIHGIAAGSAITEINLPALGVTHLTTANFALMDKNADGLISAEEYAVPFASSMVKMVAALIKAVVDGGQAPLLVPNASDNTMTLAYDAADGHVNAINRDLVEWVNDPNNRAIVDDVFNGTNVFVPGTSSGAFSPALDQEIVDLTTKVGAYNDPDTTMFPSIESLTNAVQGTWSGRDLYGNAIKFSYDPTQISDITGTMANPYQGYSDCTYTAVVNDKEQGWITTYGTLSATITATITEMTCVIGGKVPSPGYIKVWPRGHESSVDHLVLEHELNPVGVVWKNQ